MKDYKRIIEQLYDRNPDKICVKESFSGRYYTQENFAKIVNALARTIADSCSKEIIVCEDNCVELMILYFSGVLAKKVIIPIDPEKEQLEVDKINVNHPSATFFEKGYLKQLVSSLDYKNDSASIDWNSIDMDELYLITYTSGSTGQPKGVMHSIGNLFSAADAFAELLQYSSNTVMGHCMPMTYMAGILNTIIIPYLVNGEVIILPRFSMQSAFSFWNNVKACEINTLWLSPTMLRIVNMIDKKAVMKDYFHDVKMKISVGTAPLDLNLRKDFESKYNTRLYQSYGLSETLFISSEILSEEISEHTVGHLLNKVDIIFAEDSEILIDVPWMFLGYTNEDTSKYISDNKYLSGDLGVFEGENLVITGRKKELIVKGGYNINPRDIENCILENNFARECAVVSVVIKGEEQIVCCFVPEEGFDSSVCNAVVIDKLGKHCRIDIFEKMVSMPKNLNSKIDKPIITKEMCRKYGS